MRGDAFRGVRAYLVAAAIVAVALVSTIFFTQDQLPWIAFLTGILVASVLAEAARATRSEWVLMRRTAQLSAMKDKFELESSLRRLAEKKIAEDQVRLKLMDESLSTKIILVDAGGLCRYHNRAFRDWLHLKPEMIEGRPVRELFGPKSYAQIATEVRQSLDGQTLHYEFVLERPGGAVYRLLVEHVPLFDTAGKVMGFYFLADDITRRDDLSAAEKTDNMPRVPSEAQEAGGKQFISAIEAGEFHLYCQLISPLDKSRAAHYEILIRLLEEEGGMIPPGAFFPLAEKYGLMPYLDRWVVTHVLKWAATRTGRDFESVFFINLALATLGDPDFPEFVKSALEESGQIGSLLCFEVPQTWLLSHEAFIVKIRQTGCLVALGGVGKNAVVAERYPGVDFLKIDGGLVFGMLNSPADLEAVMSISRLAGITGAKTVAERVESDEVVDKLREIGIDFAQGFGISRPRRLGE